jgi:hypothetical protein
MGIYGRRGGRESSHTYFPCPSFWVASIRAAGGSTSNRSGGQLLLLDNGHESVAGIDEDLDLRRKMVAVQKRGIRNYRRHSVVDSDALAIDQRLWCSTCAAYAVEDGPNLVIHDDAS